MLKLLSAQTVENVNIHKFDRKARSTLQLINLYMITVGKVYYLDRKQRVSVRTALRFRQRTKLEWLRDAHNIDNTGYDRMTKNHT